jgi:hypothetical protein
VAVRPLALAVMMLLPLAGAGSARAVGLEGPDAALDRFGVGIGQGIDQVGGHGRDLYPFTETYLHAEARLLGGLYLGAALSYRRDHADYNYALERWRSGHPGVASQALLGYDGHGFHVSVGSWFYAAARDAGHYHAALLPYGVLRLRVGSLDGWHLNLRLVDGAPFTAEGGGPGLRLQLGLPPRGRHRLAVGVYTSLGEKVAGFALADEIDLRLTSARRLGRPSIRFGALLGTDLGHPGRPEVSVFGGLIW